MSDFFKIVFDLERDPEEPSFPPISAETLNAKRASDGRGFIIDNTPFFATGVALGDLVAATPVPGTERRYHFERVIERSGANSLSIIFLSSTDKDSVLRELERRGCYCEYGEFGQMEMLAVSAPGDDGKYEDIYAYLESREESEILSFAELSV